MLAKRRNFNRATEIYRVQGLFYRDRTRKLHVIFIYSAIHVCFGANRRTVPVGTGRYRSVPVSTSAGTGPARQNCSQLSGGSGVGIPNVQKFTVGTGRQAPVPVGFVRFRSDVRLSFFGESSSPVNEFHQGKTPLKIRPFAQGEHALNATPLFGDFPDSGSRGYYRP